MVSAWFQVVEVGLFVGSRWLLLVAVCFLISKWDDMTVSLWIHEWIHFIFLTSQLPAARFPNLVDRIQPVSAFYFSLFSSHIRVESQRPRTFSHLVFLLKPRSPIIYLLHLKWIKWRQLLASPSSGHLEEQGGLPVSIDWGRRTAQGMNEMKIQPVQTPIFTNKCCRY